MTAAEKLRQEGHVRGKKEGLVEGKKEGLVEGKRDTLLRLLRARFGELSADSVRRVQTAEARTLDRWAESLLQASELEEVWSA